MAGSTEKVLRELSLFLKCTPSERLHRPAEALAHVQTVIARACSDNSENQNLLLPLSNGLQSIELEAQRTRSDGIDLMAALTGFEVGLTFSTAFLRRPEWETFAAGASALTMMALTKPGIDWRVNRIIRGGLENLLTVGRFAYLVSSLLPESEGDSASVESSAYPGSGL